MNRNLLTAMYAATAAATSALVTNVVTTKKNQSQIDNQLRELRDAGFSGPAGHEFPHTIPLDQPIAHKAWSWISSPFRKEASEAMRQTDTLHNEVNQLKPEYRNKVLDVIKSANAANNVTAWTAKVYNIFSKEEKASSTKQQAHN